MKLKGLVAFTLLTSGLLLSNFLSASSSASIDVASSGDSSLSAALSSINGATASYQSIGALAKIALLEGTLVDVPEPYRKASLLHGAMLWEMGIVKSLYRMLITPKIKNERLVPDSSTWALGNVLSSLFTLTGNFIAPARGPARTATYLTPVLLGKIYKALLNGTIDACLSPDLFAPLLEVAQPLIMASSLKRAEERGLVGDMLQKRAEQNARQQLHELMINNNKLIVALRGCGGERTPISASVIVAFFWAKYVMGVAGALISQDNAKRHIEDFRLAAGIPTIAAAGSFEGPVFLGEHDAIIRLEEKAIGRIEAMYHNDMPKPFGQGEAVLKDGQTFTDCGETGMWMLMLSAFYNPKEQSFSMPSRPDEGFYDVAIQRYVKTHPRMSDHISQEARNERAEIMSQRSCITYAKEGCDLVCNFQNLMSLLAQLVPGVYDGMITSCGCLLASVTDRNAHIKEHFSSSPACAKIMLEMFAETHDLFISNFMQADEAGDSVEVSWHVSRTDPLEATSFLCFNAKKSHMDCELQGVIEGDDEQLNDLILGSCDAIASVPENPDVIDPLLFAAARMRYQHDALAVFVSLRPFWGDEACAKIINNIDAWGLLSEEDKGKIDQCRAFFEVAFVEAASLGLLSACRYYYSCLLKQGIKPSISIALPRAAANGHLAVVKYLCEHFTVDLCSRGRESGKTSFLRAVEQGYLAVADYLYVKNNAVLNIPDIKGVTPLMYAAARGFTRTVEFLCKRGAFVDATDEDGTTALMYAAMEGRQKVVNFLCKEKCANLNAAENGGMTALLYAAEEGNLEIVQDLVAYGADLDHATVAGETALDLAEQAGHIDVADFIRLQLGLSSAEE